MSPIEEYINDAEKDQQPMLKEIYQLIKEMLPVETTEKLSYANLLFNGKFGSLWRDEKTPRFLSDTKCDVGI
jgi:hypothetical protein